MPRGLFFFLFSFFFLFFFFLFLLISTFRVEPTNGFVMEKPFIIQLFSQSINQSVNQSNQSISRLLRGDIHSRTPNSLFPIPYSLFPLPAASLSHSTLLSSTLHKHVPHTKHSVYSRVCTLLFCTYLPCPRIHLEVLYEPPLPSPSLSPAAPGCCKYVCMYVCMYLLSSTRVPTLLDMYVSYHIELSPPPPSMPRKVHPQRLKQFVPPRREKGGKGKGREG